RGTSLSSSATVRHVPLHQAFIALLQHLGAAMRADVVGVVADEPVTLARDTDLYLAGRGQLEALLGARFRLHLRHFAILGRCDPGIAALRTATACLLAGRPGEGPLYTVSDGEAQAALAPCPPGAEPRAAGQATACIASVVGASLRD